MWEKFTDPAINSKTGMSSMTRWREWLRRERLPAAGEAGSQSAVAPSRDAEASRTLPDQFKPLTPEQWDASEAARVVAMKRFGRTVRPARRPS